MASLCHNIQSNKNYLDHDAKFDMKISNIGTLLQKVNGSGSFCKGPWISKV